MKKKCVIFFILSLFSINSNSTTLTKYNKEIPSHITFLNTLIQILNNNRETEPDVELINGTKINIVSVIDAYIIKNMDDRDVGLLTLSDKINYPKSAIELSVFILPRYRKMGHATNAFLAAETLIKTDKTRSLSTAIVGKHQRCKDISKKLLEKVKYQLLSTTTLNELDYDSYIKHLL